ncbi:hypothetical protein ACXJJ3_36950 [Kribbella sp. WER1]
MTANRRLAYSVALGLPTAALLVWMIVLLGWAGVLLSVATGVGAFVAYRRLAGRSAGSDRAETSSLATSGLPTADETVFLDLAATVHWTAARPESYHVDVARAFVLRRAREVTSKCHPAQYSLAQHELAAAIGRPQPVEDLEVWATEVRFDLPQAVQQHLAQMDEAHRAGLLWEVSALNQRRIRDHLRNDALRTPASAIVWWLAQNEGSVQRAVELADVLAKLSQLATGQDQPDGTTDVQAMVDAIQRLEDTARRPAAHDLAEAFDQAGLAEVATSLRERYGLPTLRSVVDLPASSDGEAESFGLAGEG